MDLIAIAETQINPLLLDSTYNIPQHLFVSEAHYCIISNNANELIARYQQGGILTAVRGETCSFIQSTGEDSSKLG